MKILFAIILLLFFMGSSAFCQTKVGTTAANFLTIPVGARAASMGGAFVAIANDVSTIFWNPGGLSRLPQSEFNITHANWLVGTDLNWLGIAFKFGSSALGVSINQLDYGKEEITTALNPEGTGEKWSAQDIAAGLTYSRNLTDRFSVGGSVKYIQQKIAHESASAVGFDVGLLFTTDLRGLRLGMNICNFGSELRMNGEDLLQPVDIDPGNSGNNDNIVSRLDTDSWPLPLFFTVGLGFDAIRSEQWRLSLGSDAIHPNNQTLHLNTGGEFVWNDFFALRAGYNSLFKEAAEEGLSLGFGINYNFRTIALKLDYGYLDFGVFDSVSRYSLSIGF
ncbi:MAG: PorV/PorQ family protein [Calditrichia bacterium]